MAKRKTVNVVEMLHTVNDMLADSAYDDDRHQQFRMGAIVLLEHVLE